MTNGSERGGLLHLREIGAFSLMWRKGGIEGRRFEHGGFRGWLSGDPWFEWTEPDMAGGCITRGLWLGNLQVWWSYPTRAVKAAQEVFWAERRAQTEQWLAREVGETTPVT